MKLSEIAAIIESVAPLACQEEYDNAGLTIGDASQEVSAILLCIDVTEEVIEESIQLGANLVISHHPVIFNHLKHITGKRYTEIIILSAIRHNIALYCAHTNIDNISEGVNRKICSKLEIYKTKILAPLQNKLKKLVVYVPSEKADEVRSALFDAGAGNIGNYSSCSFNVEGKGSFRASEGSYPYVGEIDKLHVEGETRIETVFPAYLKAIIIEALLKVHPYEEVAYDIFSIDNNFEIAGSGMIGELPTPIGELEFIKKIKDTFKCYTVRHSRFLNKPVKKIAVCGGSGAFLLKKAISADADMFITSDIKYHQFFDPEDKLVLVDIGHYESEQFTIEIFYEILIKKLPNFAIHFSRIIYYI
jgi:dinuclear metal center YbgI/SA1388 family protein